MRRSFDRFASLRLLPLALLLLLVLVAVAGCRETNLPSPATGIDAPPAVRLPVRLIVSEYHETYSLVLSLAPDNPADRRPLARIEHAANWPPRIASAAGGNVLAYTVLTADARAAETEGSLWVVTLNQKQPRRLAARIDARTPPALAADGSRVTVHRAARGGDGALTYTLEDVETSSGKTVILAQEPAAVRLFPVGYTSDAGGFLYVRYGKEGAYLTEVSLSDRSARTIARLADSAARDFHLSRGGDQLLYLAATGSPPHYRAYVAKISSGDVQPLLPDQLRTDDVGVAWRPTDRPVATIGSVEVAGEPAGIVAGSDGSVLVRRTAGFDAPVAWSPDGRYLYARSFSGRSADDPGSEQPVLLDAEGARLPIPAAHPIAFVGWGGDAP